jgi:hypothetical protein
MSVFFHCLKFAVRRSTSYLVFHLLRPVSIIQPWSESEASAPSLAILLRIRLATLDANLGVIVPAAAIGPRPLVSRLSSSTLRLPLKMQFQAPHISPPIVLGIVGGGSNGEGAMGRGQRGGGMGLQALQPREAVHHHYDCLFTTVSSYRWVDDRIGWQYWWSERGTQCNVERVSGKGRMF